MSSKKKNTRRGASSADPRMFIDAQLAALNKLDEEHFHDDDGYDFSREFLSSMRDVLDQYLDESPSGD